MKAKLVKTAKLYALKTDDIIATNDDYFSTKLEHPYRLSTKNCEAIVNGYDLDELVDEWCKGNSRAEDDFIAGFQKALEILGDKKFSEDDITKAYNQGEEDCYKSGAVSAKRNKYIQSLQQTEWEVMIEMEKVKDETKIVGAVKGVKGSGNKITTYKLVPKLDADGCLILKRK